MPEAACVVRRGTGAFARRDGLVRGSVWASYTHLHAVAAPQWAEGLLRAARARHSSQQPCRPARDGVTYRESI
jgi:cobyrinic acid a,c-diamide synthase